MHGLAWAACFASAGLEGHSTSRGAEPWGLKYHAQGHKNKIKKKQKKKGNRSYQPACVQIKVRALVGSFFVFFFVVYFNFIFILFCLIYFDNRGAATERERERKRERERERANSIRGVGGKERARTQRCEGRKRAHRGSTEQYLQKADLCHANLRKGRGKHAGSHTRFVSIFFILFFLWAPLLGAMSYANLIVHETKSASSPLRTFLSIKFNLI